MPNHTFILSIRTEINSVPKWNDRMTGSLRFKQEGIVVYIDGFRIIPHDNLVPAWEHRDEHGYLIDEGTGIEAGSPNGQLLLQCFPNHFDVVPVSTWVAPVNDEEPYDGVPADTGSV
jgi:hypothetical protein